MGRKYKKFVASKTNIFTNVTNVPEVVYFEETSKLTTNADICSNQLNKELDEISAVFFPSGSNNQLRLGQRFNELSVHLAELNISRSHYSQAATDAADMANCLYFV